MSETTQQILTPASNGYGAESIQVLEGLEERFLNCVLGIFRIMRDALGDSEELAIVSLYEQLESGYVAVLGGMDKFQIMVCHCLPCELC